MTLTCPTGGNMAAIAKQLHSTALQVEADIYAVEQQMRAAVNLPTVVLTSTGAVAGIVDSVNRDVGVAATWATTFDNTKGGSGSGSGGFGPQNFGNFTSVLGEGLYEVGFFCTLVASGAVNDNSNRLAWIDQMRPDPTATSGESMIQRCGYTMFETNTGVGTELSFAGEFRARPLDRFAFFVLHTNIASTLTMNAGAIIWASKTSESTLTRVL